MASFKLKFEVTLANNCPLYDKGDRFVIKDTVMKVPDNKSTCLILSRNLTELLIKLLDVEEDTWNIDFDKIHSCGGCTGLIKFSQQTSSKEENAILQHILTSQKDILDFLAECELFKKVEIEVIAKLLANARKITLQPGTVFIKKGQRLEDVYLILSGEASVLDQETEIAVLKTGQLFGEMSLLCSQPATATIVIKDNAQILAIPSIEFRSLMKQHSSVQEQLTRLLVTRLAESNVNRLQDMNYAMRGHLDEIEPVELLQAINMFRLTGSLKLKLVDNTARIAFRQGSIVNAAYQDLNDKNALFAILSQREGSYLFDGELQPDELQSPSIGNFMGLLMEGLQKVDEDQD